MDKSIVYKARREIITPLGSLYNHLHHTTTNLNENKLRALAFASHVNRGFHSTFKLPMN